MNQDNYEYLSKQLLYSGFGEGMNEQLKEHMERGTAEFTLSHQQQFGKDLTDAKLNFSRSEKGYYFFNKYELTVHQDDQKDKTLTQTYYNGKDNSYTLKEGYNLLCGRAVHKDKLNKEQEAYSVWDKLDFTEKNKYGNYPVVSYGDKYGFNLEKELDKHPIKVLKNAEDRELLIGSLKKGNRQLIKLEREGEVLERYIEANPKMRRIDFYGKDGLAVTDNQQLNTAKELELKKTASKKVQQETVGVKKPKTSKGKGVTQ